MAVLRTSRQRAFGEPRVNRHQAVRRRLVMGIAICLALFAGGLCAVAQEPSEDQVKAAFLVNFARYVEWPKTASAESNSPIVFAVMGDSDVVPALQKMLQGRTVNGHPLRFRQIQETDHDLNFQILFVSGSQTITPAELSQMKSGSILTVGESDDFLGEGGMIRLARKDRRVRVEVNLQVAKAAGLKISSKLLSIAEVVKGKPD